jgi:hypothetical protein
MSIQPGTVCLIVGGPTENLGKTVFVVGKPDDPRLPDLQGSGKTWDVQMLVTELIGPDGEGYLRGKIGENCLATLNFTMDEARAMREKALSEIIALAMRKLADEDWFDSND